MHQSQRPTASPWNRVADFARAHEIGVDEIVELDLLCTASAEVLDVQGASITSGTGTSLAFAPDRLSGLIEVDTLQYDLAAGPGPTAISGAETVRVDDTTTDGRWPDFLAAATDAGFRAVLAVPMTPLEGADAVLSAYSTSARAWSDDDQAAAVVLCAIATSWLSGRHVLHEQARLVDQLQHALESRVLIEQAKGMLAALEAVRPDAAFELMRSHARRRGIPVREVAHAVVHLGFRPPPQAAVGAAGGAAEGDIDGRAGV